VARASADGHTAALPLSARLGAAIVGPASIRRLTIAHAVDDLGDSLITLSLIGSLFFSVSLEASRSRILLYLLLTALPLAIVAQVVGPALDRIRAGSRLVIVCSHLARALFALLLSSSLLSLAFYPLVFGILLSRKAYGLAKTAMVAQLAPERAELVAASGHLARTGTIAGGVGTAVGGGLIAVLGVSWLPGAAALVFVVAAVLAGRIPSPAVEARAESAMIRVETPLAVRRAAPAVATIRAAEGALTFLLALSIKRGGGDEWIFVAALVAAGIGTFLGTMVSPRLNRVFSLDGIVVLTLLVPGAMSAFGVLTIGSFSIVAIALAIGLGGSVAARAMDALYGRVPLLMRGRVISRNELFFQLANVTGAAVAVLVYPGPRVGFAAVAVALILGGVTYASQLRLSLRSEAGRWLLGQRQRVGTEALPLALLAEAMRFAEQGDHYVAIVVADSAVRVLDARAPVSSESTKLPAWESLAETVADVVIGTLEPTSENSLAIINAAAALIAERTGRSGERSGATASRQEPRPEAGR
jgi:predicted MFS family arabinose efflux permease